MKNTKIQWAGSSWTPFRAKLKESGEEGWMCEMVGEGCKNCYAQRINMQNGTGLPYDRASVEKIMAFVSWKGQTSFDWPLRLQKSDTIFTCSMTDWMYQGYKKEWQSMLLGVMALASQHTFITLTKRYDNLTNMLLNIHAVGEDRAIALPGDKIFTDASIRANSLQAKYFPIGSKRHTLTLAFQEHLARVKQARKPVAWAQSARLPWPPRNVIFGFSATSVKDAEEVVRCTRLLRRVFPDILLAISQEPAIDMIDWEKLGLQNEADWIIWGGESDPIAPRKPHPDSWDATRDWAQKYGVQLFWKQAGDALTKEYNLPGTHGDNPHYPKTAELFKGAVRETLDMEGHLV